MTSQLAPLPIAKFFDNNGFPLAFGLLTTYAAGTTNPLATYVDSTQTTQNTNPVVLNFRGECQLWLDPTKAYKFLLQDLLGNTVPGWPVDNITIGNANPTYSIIPGTDNLYNLGSVTFSWANVYAKTNLFVGPNLLPVLNADGNIVYYARTAAEIAAGVTPTDFGYAPGNVLRYGADPTGMADSTVAFNNATFANYSTITAPTAYKTVYVPAGQYKLTDTVYVPPGTIIHGDGMSSYLDCSAGGTSFGSGTHNVFQMGWFLVGGVATKGTGVLTGGYPPEIYGFFMNGGPGSAYNIYINYPGVLAHDMWLGAPGGGVYLAGGYIYDLEIDAGGQAVTVGPGINQTVSNCRFYFQNVNVNFDTSTGDISDCVFNGCTFEYPKINGIQLGSGTVNVRGIKFVGCDFIHNPGSGVTNFSDFVSVGLANAQIEFYSCTFHNWGKFGSLAPSYAALVQASGAIVDFKGCIFDGSPSNVAYTASTNASVLQLNQGSVRMTDCVIRNLPATFGQGINLGGGGNVNTLHIDGLIYSGTPQGTFAISAISQAAAAVVTSSSALTVNPFQVGAQLAFTGVGGMTQINGAVGLITAIGGSAGAWTATVAINSSGFGAFTSGGSVLQELPLVSITNTASTTACYLANVKGDQLQPLINPQSNVLVRIKNCTDWFGPIAALSTSNYVLLPYQNANLWQFALAANQNSGGSGSYRKARLDFIEKDNDFSGSLKSFLTQATAVQGAANTNGTLTLTAEFNQVGGGANIASSNSGCIAVSWPNTYSFVSVDVQQIVSG